MKLYLLKQNDNDNDDTYDSCLVCADDKEDAMTITPDGEVFKESEKGYWALKSSAITCEEIGEANKNQSKGVIISSFNAG